MKPWRALGDGRPAAESSVQVMVAGSNEYRSSRGTADGGLGGLPGMWWKVGGKHGWVVQKVRVVAQEASPQGGGGIDCVSFTPVRLPA